ncbi:MAG: hypothetical protein KGO01_15470 [Burkholderiales bacterium]|nr:hypothetical protein [Burkholderiales bacterium]MDE1927137.1 hypothetical protein [Burkholderiales bacterium]
MRAILTRQHRIPILEIRGVTRSKCESFMNSFCKLIFLDGVRPLFRMDGATVLTPAEQCLVGAAIRLPAIRMMRVPRIVA